MNKGEERIKRIKEKFKDLPAFEQKAFCWLVEHLDLANEMSQEKSFTKEEIDKYTRLAYESKDYALLALITYIEVKDKSK